LLVAGPVDPLDSGVCPFVLCLHVSEDCLNLQHVTCYERGLTKFLTTHLYWLLMRTRRAWAYWNSAG
jgi:hypothetical protein